MNGEIPTIHYTFRAQRKDGSIVIIEVLGSPGQYNGRPAILGTAMDITERKLAEAKLAEASNLLETLLENSPDHIYFKDRNRVSCASAGASQTCSVMSSPKELTGKTDFDFFPDRSRARGVRGRTGNHPHRQAHHRQSRNAKPIADGRVTWALTTKLPWRDKRRKNHRHLRHFQGRHRRQGGRGQTRLRTRSVPRVAGKFPGRHLFQGSPVTLRARQPIQGGTLAADVLHNVIAPSNPDVDSRGIAGASYEREATSAEWLIGKTDFDTFTEERARDALSKTNRKSSAPASPSSAKSNARRRPTAKSPGASPPKCPGATRTEKSSAPSASRKDITALKASRGRTRSRAPAPARNLAPGRHGRSRHRRAAQRRQRAQQRQRLLLADHRPRQSVQDRQPRQSRRAARSKTATASANFSPTIRTASRFPAISPRWPNIWPTNNPLCCRNSNSS